MDQQNYDILVWNTRRLNARCRRDNLCEVVNRCNATIVCIQETKLSVISPFLINEILGTRFSSFAYLPSIGTSGGILIACRGPESSCVMLHKGSFSVSIMIEQPACIGASQEYTDHRQTSTRSSSWMGCIQSKIPSHAHGWWREILISSLMLLTRTI
uniref:Endonuclease/exonuclease/phosphatase domain-containing protein n=1 Tax=Setaria viridis TaxID=4556 RepID=A0A4U6TZE3_SETVI|nr:LOW QUALITY PROTEIN: hypothetical protein SEVIR_7G231900v2 [Setaria viridis]